MRNVIIACALLASFTAAPVAAADDPGQADLDKAFDARLSAKSLVEVGKVVDLCRTAIKKGLDEENEKFAKQLLASSLYQRGEALAEGVLDAVTPDPRLPAMRLAAISDLEEAVKFDPMLWPARVLSARLHLLGASDPKRARALLDEVIDAEEADADVRAEALTYRSILQTDPEQRLADLDAAVELSGNVAQAYRLRAALNLSSNKAEEAVADFDAALKLEPDHAGTYEARGLALATLKKWDEARQSLTRAVELFPKSSNALLQRGRVNMLAGDHAAAAADADAVLKIVPDLSDALLLRSHAKLAAGDKAAALADVNRVLERTPNAPQALRTRIAISLNDQATADAIADLERLAQIEPDSTDIVLQWAALENSRKHNRRAIELLDEVIAKEAQNWRALRIRGDARLGLAKHHEAIADYEAALKIEPKDAGLLNNLAWVLATSTVDDVRNGARAVELAEAACRETEFKQAHILSTLAASYAEQGDFAAARKWSQKALDVATNAEKPGLRKEMASYEAEKPWRESLSDDEKSANDDSK